jgi:hypothetical protein
MEEFNRLENLTKTKGYKDAEKKISSWEIRLEKADVDEAKRILDEKDKFFTKMRSAKPELYEVFAIDDKTLSENIYKKITGDEIIID